MRWIVSWRSLHVRAIDDAELVGQSRMSRGTLAEYTLLQIQVYSRFRLHFRVSVPVSLSDALCSAFLIAHEAPPARGRKHRSALRHEYLQATGHKRG